jgi:hypothetical protein
MRIWKIGLGLILGCAIVAAGFAADVYRIKMVNILPIESYAAQKEISGITVALDPYSTNDKSFTAFDVKTLNSHGCYPLHIIIKNSTTRYLTLRTQDIYLITNTKERRYPYPASLIVEQITLSGLLPKPKNKAEGGTPLADFASKQLSNRTIDPGAISDGFLYFPTSTPRVDLFAGATLFIPKFVDEATQKQIGPFEILIAPAADSK